MALTQPVGSGILNVIRLSGRGIVDVMRPLFRNKRWQKGDIRSHTIYQGSLYDAEGKQYLDEVVLLVFLSPKSYTREDMIEIQLHQNPYVLQRVIQMLHARGIAYALPGEFSKRAFINGRINLLQAQALDDYIRSANVVHSLNSLRILRGELNELLSGFCGALVEHLALVEANIDFSEEAIECIDRQSLGRALDDLSERMQAIVSRSRTMAPFGKGLKLTIVGKANVGKSSLFNRLYGRERAIVSATPGTTRDYISEVLAHGSARLEIVDTAGLRRPVAEVEKKGMDYTMANLADANCVLLVLDLSKPIDGDDERIMQRVSALGNEVFLVFNKCDLPERLDRRQATGRFPGRGFTVSAVTGRGMDALLSAIKGYMARTVPQGGGIFLARQQQVALLRQAAREVAEAARLCNRDPAPEELLALHLREALDRLYSLQGRNAGQDVLNNLFSRFCIGK